MKEKIRGILDNLKTELEGIKDTKAVQDLKVKYLGKKGEITGLMKAIGKAAPEERAKIGQVVNEARKIAEEKFDKVLTDIKETEKQACRGLQQFAVVQTTSFLINMS